MDNKTKIMIKIMDNEKVARKGERNKIRSTFYKQHKGAYYEEEHLKKILSTLMLNAREPLGPFGPKMRERDINYDIKRGYIIKEIYTHC